MRAKCWLKKFEGGRQLEKPRQEWEDNMAADLTFFKAYLLRDAPTV